MTDTISSEDRPDWPLLDRPVGPSRGWRGSWRGLDAGVRTTALTTAVSLVLVGGVTTAAIRNLGGPADPATLIPASAFGVAQLDLSLPNGQAGALARFDDRLPVAFPGMGSARDRLLAKFLDKTSDPHVDYRTQVRPWLGDRVAIAGWLDAAGKPQLEVLLASTDDAAARTAIRRASKDIGLAFAHGYAVLANNQAAADEAVKAAAASSLADHSPYAGDIATLPGTPALTAWVDGPAALQAVRAKANADLGVFDPTRAIEPKGRVAVGLSVADDGAHGAAVQLDAVEHDAATSSQTASADRLRDLPDGTFAAMELGDPTGTIEALTPALGPLALFLAPIPTDSTGSGGSSETCTSTGNSTFCTTQGTPDTTLPSPLSELSKITGLSLPGDLEVLLGGGAVLAYGGLTTSGMPKIGVRSTPADNTSAAGVVSKLRATLAPTGIQLAERSAGNDYVVATDGGYADQLATAGGLGRKPAVADALAGMPAQVQFAAYVDLGSLLPLLHGAADLQHLSAAGMWVGAINGETHVRVRLVVS